MLLYCYFGVLRVDQSGVFITLILNYDALISVRSLVYFSSILASISYLSFGCFTRPVSTNIGQTVVVWMPSLPRVLSSSFSASVNPYAAYLEELHKKEKPFKSKCTKVQKSITRLYKASEMSYTIAELLKSVFNNVYFNFNKA